MTSTDATPSAGAASAGAASAGEAPAGEPAAGVADPQERIPRLEALTGLRWFAALAVFAFHVSEFYPVPGMRDLALFGNSGVTFFFVLSGFVLTWSHRRVDTALRFWWRRFVRIWPALAASTFLAIPVFYTNRGIPFDDAARHGVLYSLLMIQAWWPSTLFAGNPAAWSLSDEAFFYLLFPLLARPLLRLPTWFVGLLALALVGVNSYARWWAWENHPDQQTMHLLFIAPIGRLGEFVLGMAVAAAIRRGWRCPVPVWTAIAAVAGGVWFLWSCRVHPGGLFDKLQADQAMNQVMGPLYALLIASTASRDLRARWMVLGSRPMVALGRWSYSFYLVHATVLYALVQRWHPAAKESWDNWSLIATTAVVGLIVALALYTIVEHPIEEAGRALLRLQPRRWWRRWRDGREASRRAAAG